MFNFRKKKPARQEIDNYIIELSEEKVVVTTKVKLWRVEYLSTTSPYMLFSMAWNDTATLAVICRYLHVNVELIVDGTYVVKTMKAADTYIRSKEVAPKVSKAEDDEILRETQAMMEQSQDAVDKHIAAQKRSEVADATAHKRSEVAAQKENTNKKKKK